MTGPLFSSGLKLMERMSNLDNSKFIVVGMGSMQSGCNLVAPVLQYK
jgi:hypothetical protein